MTFAEDLQHPVSYETDEIRGLQLRIYREIGILAVAAALNVSAEECEPFGEVDIGDKASMPRGDERAA